MVDTATFNKLSPEEQNEFKKYSSIFIRAVKKSDSTDGYDFEQNYIIKKSKDIWYISKPGNNKAFAGVKTKSKATIEALLEDAVQNYGR